MPREDALARAYGSGAGATSERRETCWQYLDDQAAATGALPDDRTIVVERFRDEVGDWRGAC